MAMAIASQTPLPLQPVEALSSTEKILKVPLRGTFKIFSGFYNGAKRCNESVIR